jgi:hypothetical protein
MDLTMSDLSLDGHKAKPEQRQIEAVYHYIDANGKPFEVVRTNPKGFYQRQLDGRGGYINNLNSIIPTLYHQDKLKQAIDNNEPVYIVEGEKDADTLWSLGLVATTNPMGAGKWRNNYTEVLRGADLIISPDNDKPGREHANQVAKSCYSKAARIRLLELPGESKDISDWLGNGGDIEQLKRLADACPDYEPTTKRGFNWRDFAISHDDLLGKELPPVAYLVEDLLTTPGTAVLAGRKKIGKSWLGLQLSQCIASGSPFLGKTTRQGEVVHLSLEDGERRLKQRLKLQNAAKGLPVIYISKFEPLNTKAGFEALQELIKAKNPVLVVIDTLASAKNRFLDENEAGSTADLFNQLHELAITQNCVILVIAHHGKHSHDDIGFDIRGSSAISGATDTNLGLYKNTDGTFDLKAEGRDIGGVDLRISFDAEVTWCWQCKGDARDVRRAEAEDRILEAIVLLGGEADATAIAKEIDIARPTVATHLKRMREQSIVGYRILNTGKANKIIYTYPTITTVPTNPQPIVQSEGIVGFVGDTKKRIMTEGLGDLESIMKDKPPCIRGPGLCELRRDANRHFDCAFTFDDCQFKEEL